MTPFWWDSLFWMAALLALAVCALVLLRPYLGNLFDGRLSATSLAIIFYFIYSIPFAFDYLAGIIGPDEVSVQAIAMVKVSFIGMCGLVTGIVLARLIIRPRGVRALVAFEPAHLRRFFWIGVVLLALGWTLAYLGAKPFGGLIAFLGAPYHMRWEMISRGFTLWNYAVLVMKAAGIVGGFLLAGYLLLRRPLIEKLFPLIISAAILVLPALWFALWGQRRGIMVGVLVFLVLFSTYGRRIRFGYILGALGILYALLVIIAIIRVMTITTYRPGYAAVVFQEAMETGRLYGLSRNDPGLTLEPVGRIYDYQQNGGELLLGRSYAAAIAIAMPKPLRFTGDRPVNVPRWYTERFEPDLAAKGGSVAITSTAEALANFGLTGVFLVHLLIMFCFVTFEMRVSGGVLGTVLRIGTIPFYVFILHHSSDINLYKLSYILGILLFFTFLVYGPALLAGHHRVCPEEAPGLRMPTSPPEPA